jgi:hypothetical protein
MTGAAHLPPPAATHAPGPQPRQDVPQRVRGLQDVVHGAEQGGVGGQPDFGFLGLRLHDRDVVPPLAGDVLPRHRGHLR